MNRRDFVGTVFADLILALPFTGLTMVIMIFFELQEYFVMGRYLYFVVLLVCALYLNYMPCDGDLKMILYFMFITSCINSFVVVSFMFPIHPTLNAALYTAVIILAFGEIVVRMMADLTRLDSVRWKTKSIALGAVILASIYDSKILAGCVLTYVLLLYLCFLFCDIQMIIKNGYLCGYETTQRMLAAFELYSDFIILFFVISWTDANRYPYVQSP